MAVRTWEDVLLQNGLISTNPYKCWVRSLVWERD